LNLVILIPNLSGGGTENQVNLLSNSLLSFKNIHISIIYIRNGSGNYKKNKKIKYIKIKNKYKFLRLLGIVKIINTLSKKQNTVFLSCSLYFDIIFGLYKIFFDINYFIRESNSIKARKYSFKNKLRLFLNKNTKIISNNSSGEDMWKKNYNNKTYLIPNGFKINTDYNLSKSNTCIISGRFIKRKRIVESIEFFFQSSYFNKNKTKLLVFGDGPEKEEVLRCLKSYSSIRSYKGFVKNEVLLNFLKKSKFFISLSDYEGFSNVVFEALNHKCITLISKTQSHLEFFPKDIVTYVFLNSRIRSVNDLQIPSSKNLIRFLKQYEIKYISKNYFRVLKDH